jgi:hypothetical protein
MSSAAVRGVPVDERRHARGRASLWDSPNSGTTGVQMQVRYQTDREICATRGPVVIRICDGIQTELDDLLRVEKLFDELLETHADIAILLVLTHGTPLPDAAVHRYAMESAQGFGDRVVLCVALLGLGFWASTVRATMGAFTRVLRRGNVWLEGSVERAIERLTTELVGIDPDALMTAYRELWDQLGRGARRTG